MVAPCRNYTGDRLNFGLAAEEARADGIRTEVTFVADDCALPATRRIGRRGIAGTVLL
jgi:triose/dihydroxyacetone kinase / FAD-AMP lyase (cyclizing)